MLNRSVNNATLEWLGQSPVRADDNSKDTVMTVSEMFSTFNSNLAIDHLTAISQRYGELTCSLNKKFRDIESKTANTLQVGSFGRNTGIKNISDLDMLYIMPASKWASYKDGGQLTLLQDTKAAILKRYPKTAVRVDRLVVTVTYSNFHVEVQPVFENSDGDFKYPDTKSGGSWKLTKPKPERQAIADLDVGKNSNLRRLCKMTRAWKNKHGVRMGGLLIDTLSYNFLNSTEEYDSKSYLYYDYMVRDFFNYLSELKAQDYYAAPGSGQPVAVKKKFQRKAKKAYNLALSAIAADKTSGVNAKWKKVFGRPFPSKKTSEEAISPNKSAYTWRNTEQFIEDRFGVDIRFDLRIDCEVSQQGHRTFPLREFLKKHLKLHPFKSLCFTIMHVDSDLKQPYEIYWKVLNRGERAKALDKVRGQIMIGNKTKRENTQFKGGHLVECYIVQNNVVVAKDRINVPIQ